MIKNLKKGFSKIDTPDKFFFIILALFPLTLLIGNLVINFFVFLFSISFYLNFKENKKFLKNNIIYVLLFFFISLVVNIFFSSIPINSIPRVIKIIFIILFIAQTIRIFNKYNQNSVENIVFVWSIIFIVVLLDCVFEIIFGFNTLGFSSPMPGRIASFFGDELVVGAFIHGFALFFLSYLIIKKRSNYIVFLAILTIISVSFLVGERSNFIKLFFSIIIFSFLAIKVRYYYKFFTLLIIFSILFSILNFNHKYKYRYFYQVQNIFQTDGLSIFYKSSQYGAHFNTAKQIFNEYRIFGVGIKNFRYESNKTKYENKKFEANDVRQATHPHQTHLEFLSETGIFGYLSFLFFIFFSIMVSIKSYTKDKNIFQLSGLIFVLSTLIPFLPSGSFLATFNSSIFWINFAMMIGFCKSLKRKF